MTDEKLYQLMGWPTGMKIEPGDMAYRVRALVVTAERDERKAWGAALSEQARKFREDERMQQFGEERIRCAASALALEIMAIKMRSNNTSRSSAEL
jgi:hypothetical protein